MNSRIYLKIIRITPVVAAMLIFFSACGSEGSGPKIEHSAADQAIAREITLHLSDFPNGWVTRNRNSTETTCHLGLNQVTETGEATSAVFLSPTTNGRAQESSSAEIYRTAREAKTVFGQIMTTKYQDCVADTQKKALEAKGVQTEITYRGRGDTPQVGDRSGDYYIAYAFTPTKRWGVGVEFDLMYVQRGRAIISLVFTGTPSPGKSFPETWPTQSKLAALLVKRANAAISG